MRLDQIRVYRGPDSHALGRVRPQVRQHRVRGCGYLLDKRLTRVGTGVDGDGALVEVDVVEIGSADGPRQVAGQRLELDHIGPEIAEQSAAGRPGDEVGDLQHPDAIERQRVQAFGRRHFHRLGFGIVRR